METSEVTVIKKLYAKSLCAKDMTSININTDNIEYNDCIVDNLIMNEKGSNISNRLTYK